MILLFKKSIDPIVRRSDLKNLNDIAKTKNL
jgi:hypothetical protein